MPTLAKAINLLQQVVLTLVKFLFLYGPVKFCSLFLSFPFNFPTNVNRDVANVDYIIIRDQLSCLSLHATSKNVSFIEYDLT